MNHFTKNLITKGWLNISVLTKGFILPIFKYIIIKKKGGGGGWVAGEGIGNFRHDVEEIFKKQEEIDVIKVYINWNKDITKYSKKIYVKLIKKKIKAELIEHTNEKHNIKVEFIKPDSYDS